MQHRLPYSAPDGYLQTVHQRIMAKVNTTRRTSARSRLIPYLAFAGMLAVIVGVGTLFLRNVTPAISEKDILSMTDSAHIDIVLTPRTAQSVSNEDIVNYLIYCGYDF